MNTHPILHRLAQAQFLMAAGLALGSSAIAQNDECTGALPLPLGATPFDTSTATLSVTPWPCGLGGGPDLWYVFTAPTDGNFSISTCTATTYDTALELFTGTCAALVSVTCNDDTCGLQSQLGVTAQTGEQFFIRVGGYNGLNGSGTLTVEQTLPMLNPANDHYYEVIWGNVDWSTADQLASGRTFMGFPGHLVTISDAAEDAFVYSTLAGGPLGNSWLGAFQDMTSPTYSEPSGGWTWVTGEPFSYTNWTANEPNNGGGQEHYLGYFPADRWNDYTLVSGNVASFVVEYESVDIGVAYCLPGAANSTGAPATLSAFGSTSIATNDVTLAASGLPTNQFGIFVTSMVQAFVPGTGGTSNGNLCLGGTIGRYRLPGQILSSGSSGSFSFTIDLTALPQGGSFLAAMPGDTWNFQAWHRDGVGLGSNFTHGLEITLQ